MDSTKHEEEIFSKFTDVFHQFKVFCSHFHKQQIIWHFRLFVKCCAICIFLLLGFCHYINGIFDYSGYPVLFLVILTICIYNSVLQLMTDKRVENSFKDVSKAFEDMTEALSQCYHTNNTIIAKILKLLLQQMGNDKNIHLKLNDLVSIIFETNIWFVNIACMLINLFHERQLQILVLPLFIIILVTVVIDNFLIYIKKEPNKTNQNMIEEINKVCSIVNEFKEVLDDMLKSCAKMDPEMTVTKKEDNGFMKVSNLSNFFSTD